MTIKPFKAAIIVESDGQRLMYWFDPSAAVSLSIEEEFHSIYGPSETRMAVEGRFGGGVIWEGPMPEPGGMLQIEAQKKEVGP